MELPVINVAPIHRVSLKVIDKEIEFSPYTIEQEKMILTSMESEKFSDVLTNYKGILETCIKDDLDIINTPMVDIINLLINLRVKSTDETITLTRKKCIECEESYEFNVDVEQSIIYENEDTLKKIIKVDDRLKLELIPKTFKYLYGLEVTEGNLTEYDIMLTNVSHSISKVIFDGKIYTDHTPSDLCQKVLKGMTKSQIVKIHDDVEKLISIHLEINSICPHCKHEETNRVEDFLKFTN